MSNDCWSVFSIKNAVSPSSAMACLFTDAKTASEANLSLILSRLLISLWRFFRSLKECVIWSQCCHQNEQDLLIFVQRPDELVGVGWLARQRHCPGGVGRHVVSECHRVWHVGVSLLIWMLTLMIFTTLAADLLCPGAQGSVLRGWSLSLSPLWSGYSQEGSQRAMCCILIILHICMLWLCCCSACVQSFSAAIISCFTVYIFPSRETRQKIIFLHK